MRKDYAKLLGESILVSLIVLIGIQYISLSTYAVSTKRLRKNMPSCPKPRLSKRDWWTNELERRERQSQLELWQHEQEANRYEEGIMIQNSPEFTAGKYAYWQLRKILQSPSSSPSEANVVTQAPTKSTSPPVFYVSKKGPTDGTADGKSWETAWPELNQIDWQAVLRANNNNTKGDTYPGAAFNELIKVVIKIDGGAAGGFMTYYTPLKLQPMGDNPYRCHPLIRVANDPADSAKHGGQVILDGSKDTSGSPAIDASYSDGWHIWGSNGYGTNWPNQNRHAEPGFAVVNWPVGVYVSGLDYLWLDGLLIDGCGIGVLAAAAQDIPSLTIGGKHLNISPARPIAGSPDGTKSAYYAGEGLHIHSCWIKNSNDMSYQANIWIANSAPGLSPNSLFPHGRPSLDGSCIVSIDRADLMGKVDGVVYNKAQDPGIYHWYLVRGSIIGPGLRNGLVVNQNGGDIFTHGTLFIDPAKANIVKLYDGTEDVVYMANCRSVIAPSASQHEPEFLHIVEGLNDKIIYASVNGGKINVDGGRVIGHMVHQINATGNTSCLSSSMIHNHSKSIKRAASRFALKGDRHLDPPASATALAGLAPGTPLGSGFASDYSSN